MTTKVLEELADHVMKSLYKSEKVDDDIQYLPDFPTMKVFLLLILSCTLLNNSLAGLYLTNRHPKINEILGRFSFPKGSIIQDNFEDQWEKLRGKIPKVRKMKEENDDIMDQLEQRYSISRLFKKK